MGCREGRSVLVSCSFTTKMPSSFSHLGYTVDGSSVSSVHAWVMTFAPDSEVRTTEAWNDFGNDNLGVVCFSPICHAQVSRPAPASFRLCFGTP